MIRVNLSHLLPLLLLLVFASCTKKYKIEGSSSITSLDGKMLFLKSYKGGQWINVDSADVIHGLFTMKGKVDSAMLVTLYIDGESIMPLVLEDGKMDVSITDSQLDARGTPLNDALYSFLAKRNAFELGISELDSKEARMVMDGADLTEVHDQLSKENAILVKKMNDYVKDFISTNYNNVLGPGVFMMLCSSLPYPVMTPQIEEIINNAPPTFQNNPLIRDFLVKAKENMQLIDEHRRMEENIAIKQQNQGDVKLP